MIRYILAETGYFLEIDWLPKDFKEDLSRM